MELSHEIKEIGLKVCVISPLRITAQSIQNILKDEEFVDESVESWYVRMVSDFITYKVRNDHRDLLAGHRKTRETLQVYGYALFYV